MRKHILFLLTASTMLLTVPTPSFAAESAPQISEIEAIDSSLVPYASNYFSGSTGTMNSLNGQESTAFNISSGSVPSNAKVSSVTLNVTVSSGSAPFYLQVKHPNGDIAQEYITGSGSKSVTLPQFNDTDPTGTWKVSIISTGVVSTATARMTVNYTY
ncbi:hypothetical protein ACIQXF_13050 [Lysinibacillus sp. NPDC097231]|uniref:hypothetical protein n=1 Tax=Lysinibacillus sp. NPDC097231 TaxID=3364142 RepID=UPI0037F27137